VLHVFALFCFLCHASRSRFLTDWDDLYTPKRLFPTNDVLFGGGISTVFDNFQNTSPKWAVMGHFQAY